MFEHHHQPLLPKAAFYRRLLRHVGLAFGMLVVSLAIGMIGYYTLIFRSWMDALVWAAMLLGGMGPIEKPGDLSTPAGKLFAAAYALFSGVVFLIAIGVFLAPIIHRFMHHFHLEEDRE